MNRLSFRAAAAALAFALLPVAGCTIGEAPAGSAGETARLREVMEAIGSRYVRRVPDETLLRDGLKGMVAGLDPHSAYMDAKDYAEFRASTRGEFAGIGAELARDGARTKVVTPIDDTPAARAGLRVGDIIQRVNGEAVDGLDLNEVVQRIRGGPGTPVRLTIARGTEPPFDLTLTRAVVQIEPVKARLAAGRQGYARISIFNEQTNDKLREAVARLKREAGGRLAGFVLDLRNNPGGLLNQAVAVAGDFLDGGTIVSTSGRDGRRTRSFEAPSRGDLLEGTPIVVLVNGASASAAEIVAGALQDYGRATVMGTRSFGKGSVQTVLPLSEGTAVRLTTDLYYTPSGRSIQAEGIVPDIVAAVPLDQQIPGARVTREANLRNALKPAGGPNQPVVQMTPADPEQAEEGATGAMDPFVVGTDRDAQLSAALAALRAGRIGVEARPRQGRGGA